VTGYPRAADLRLIPMELDADRSRARFELGEGQTRFDGAMYGGTGIAAAVMAMEAASQRPAVWATIQFVTSPHSGSVIECSIDTLAQGGRISQLQVTGRVGGEVAFVALGSTGLPREHGLTGQFHSMPNAPAPEDTPPRMHFSRSPDFEAHEHSYISRVDMRMIEGEGNVLMWGRLLGERILTPAGVAFLADMVPVAVTRAAGKLGAGFSLDNAVRFGPEPDGEWVLLELIGDVANHGYGHGSFRAFTPRGVLVATGGQTANMRFVVESEAEFAARIAERRPG
jgi:acyl-CoA thioesterase